MSDESEKVNSPRGKNGGARPGAGRKRKQDKFANVIDRAERRIADKLPEIIDRMFELANGVLVEEVPIEGQPFVYRKPPDYKAAAYLIDRIMGKPVDRKEVTGKDGAPVAVQFYSYDALTSEITE